MDLCTSKFELNMLVFVNIPFQLCKFACAIFIVFIALALQLRVPCRTFLEVQRVFILQQKFVEAAKWLYARTAIALVCLPLHVSFPWDLQTTISGAILAICCIRFKFDGWKLLFACLLGQQSQWCLSFPDKLELCGASSIMNNAKCVTAFTFKKIQMEISAAEKTVICLLRWEANTIDIVEGSMKKGQLLWKIIQKLKSIDGIRKVDLQPAFLFFTVHYVGN